MKVVSFFFTLAFSALALAHGPPQPHSNVVDVSAQLAWDRTIGQGAPALVEL